jgi:hypothetical protein
MSPCCPVAGWADSLCCGLAWRDVASDTHFRTPMNWKGDKSNEVGKNLSVLPWPVSRTISLSDVRYDTTGSC